MTLRLHGPTAAVHDHITGGRGDFDQVMADLQQAEHTEVITEVTRTNVRNLAALARWLTEPVRAAKVTRWTLVWPGAQAPGLSLPRLGMVAPRILHAAALARKAGLEVATAGLPLCVLGPHAQFTAPGDPRAYASVCEGCDVRGQCPGVPAAYLQDFGRDLELRSLRA